MAVTNDIQAWPYEPADSTKLVAYGIGANQQLYQGCIALVSGSGSTSVGFLKNAATPGAADLVAGIVGPPAGGTATQALPGVLGGSTDGSVWDNVLTGTFYLQSGTGADTLTAANNGLTVYYIGENAQGPLASVLQSNGGGNRPVLGIQFPQDPGIAGGCLPGSNYWPIKLNKIGGP